MPSGRGPSISTEVVAPERAAYGFRIAGIEDGRSLAVRGAGSWPQLSIERHLASGPDPTGDSVTESRASIQTPAATLILDRAQARVEVHSRASVPNPDLIHPCLWPAAAVFARWGGAETLHAGAFIAPDGGAWALLGDRSAGKSSLLAALALAGRQVLADDLVVVDGGDCFAGPRCIDLRAQTVAALGLERRTFAVRSTERRRLILSPADGRARLRGFVHLAWGAEVSVEPVTPAESLGLLVDHRRVSMLGANVDQLLDLAGLPAVRLRRPQSWDALPRACEKLAAAGTHSG